MGVKLTQALCLAASPTSRRVMMRAEQMLARSVPLEDFSRNDWAVYPYLYWLRLPCGSRVAKEFASLRDPLTVEKLLWVVQKTGKVPPDTLRILSKLKGRRCVARYAEILGRRQALRTYYRIGRLAGRHAESWLQVMETIAAEPEGEEFARVANVGLLHGLM